LDTLGYMDDVTTELKQKIQKIIDLIKQDLSTIRTGRASSSLVENIVIDAYGGSAKLKVLELATIGTTDARTIVITPFDHSVIQEIEKGIVAANVGLNPIVDGQILRISIPPLSEERREELIKGMKHKLENGRIMVRQARHDAMESVKHANNDKEISDDDMHRHEKDIQRIIDETIASIDAMGAQKEEELMQV
jgi:ribosome recycling factor